MKIEMSMGTYAPMCLKVIMLNVDGMCESEIDILLCESSVALYVWNLFPMQLFLRMKIEMSIATYAPMCLKIMLNVDGCVNQRLFIA